MISVFLCIIHIKTIDGFVPEWCTSNDIVFWTLFLVIAPCCGFADEITIVADPWCPFTCQQDASRPGFMIEIASNVFSKAGHTVKFMNIDWDKALEETRKGSYNAVAGAYKEDAPDFIFPIQSQGVAGNVFFVKKGSIWRYTGAESLQKVKVGVIKKQYAELP